MIEYHPYDLDIDGETDVNRRNIERIETATYRKEEIRFAVISDTQRWYDETEDAVEALNRPMTWISCFTRAICPTSA